MKIKDLKANPKNPRTISDEKLAMLKKAIAEFGDLSGIVFNRKTKHLVGGHQRTKGFDPSAEIHIEKKFSKPTKTGTVAVGYVLVNGERHSYREVEWDKIREQAANIAANKGAGEWDLPQLEEWFRELDDFGFDLDLTMFATVDRGTIFGVNEGKEVTGAKELNSGDFENFTHSCPKCGFEWDAKDKT